MREEDSWGQTRGGRTANMSQTVKATPGFPREARAGLQGSTTVEKIKLENNSTGTCPNGENKFFFPTPG